MTKGILDFATQLTQQGIEDLHIRLMAKRANARKALIQGIDELIDAATDEQVICLLRESRTIRIAPGPKRITRNAVSRKGAA